MAKWENNQDTTFIKLKLVNKSVSFKFNTGAEVNVKVFKTIQAKLCSFHITKKLDVAEQDNFRVYTKASKAFFFCFVVKTNAVPLLWFRQCQELKLDQGYLCSWHFKSQNTNTYSKFISQEGILNVNHAYKSSHSTETAFLKIQNDISLSVDSRKAVALTLLDLSTAFDTIDHSLLYDCLHDWFGLDGTVLLWIKTL